MIKTLICAFFCFTPFGAAIAEDAFTNTIDEKLATVIDEVGMTGAAVGVVQGESLVFTKGYGVIEAGKDAVVTPSHVFHWASVAKPLVGIAIMQLVERGQLQLDDLVIDHAPYFSMADERYRNITIRQLLLHTSGMPDVEDYQWNKPQHDEGALERWIREQTTASLLFTPGDSQQYSNIGYELLGVVIAETSGLSFEGYMQENLFSPLGMNNSSFILSDINPTLRTVGHTGNPRKPVEHYPYNRRHAPSSTLNSNIEDMARLAQALLNDGMLGDAVLLAPETLAAMWSPGQTISGAPYRATALGWGVRNYKGYTLIGHSGGDDGFRSYFALIPEADIAVLLEANDEIAIMSPSPDEPLLRMLNIALDEALKNQPH